MVPAIPADLYIGPSISAHVHAKAGVYLSDPIKISDGNKN